MAPEPMVLIQRLKQDKEKVRALGSSITRMRDEIKYCKDCYNVSDTEICSICANKMRDDSLLCVVENFRDVIAIENTEIFKGKYHVLGGVISPIDGIGPERLNINQLVERVQRENIKEVLMALSPTIEGDTTIFYLSKKLQPLGVQITTIARGVSFGGELEYTDELTLARSIATRLPYENILVKSGSQ